MCKIFLDKKSHYHCWQKRLPFLPVIISYRWAMAIKIHTLVSVVSPSGGCVNYLCIVCFNCISIKWRFLPREVPWPCIARCGHKLYSCKSNQSLSSSCWKLLFSDALCYWFPSKREGIVTVWYVNFISSAFSISLTLISSLRWWCVPGSAPAGWNGALALAICVSLLAAPSLRN